MRHSTFAFLKLIVNDLSGMAHFYESAFGFIRHDGFENEEMEEVLLRQDGHDFLLGLLRWKDGRIIAPGTAHGPVGFLTSDIEQALGQAVTHGASVEQDIIDVPGSRVAFLLDPEGHEIELVQFA